MCDLWCSTLVILGLFTMLITKLDLRFIYGTLIYIFLRPSSHIVFFFEKYQKYRNQYTQSTITDINFF